MVKIDHDENCDDVDDEVMMMMVRVLLKMLH